MSIHFIELFHKFFIINMKRKKIAYKFMYLKMVIVHFRSKITSNLLQSFFSKKEGQAKIKASGLLSSFLFHEFHFMVFFIVDHLKPCFQSNPIKNHTLYT